MPTTQAGGQQAAAEKQRHQERVAVIGRQVLDALGRPADLHAVRVRPLWEDHYRVNILVGTDAASARIAQSYFLVTDGDGNVLASTPPISRQY